MVIFYYPLKHNNINQQYVNIISPSWQNISAVNSHHHDKTEQSVDVHCMGSRIIYRVADKSLVRPGRKQATETENFDVNVYNLLS